MSFSFSINSKSQSNRLKKPTASFSDAAAADSPTATYVSEFRADEPVEPKLKSITPIPNGWRPHKKLKNLPNLPPLSNGSDTALQFELDPGSIPEDCDNSMGFGLNLRQPSASVSDVPTLSRDERVSDLELRKLREDLEKLPEDTGFDEFDDVPVEGYGAALLAGYGWKEGRGIGRNAKEDVKIAEVTRKAGRGGLGFTGELPGNHINTNGNAGEDSRNTNAKRKVSSSSNGNAVVDLEEANSRREKIEDRKERKEKNGFGVGKEVCIVNGRDMGMKGKIVEVRDGGDLLVVRMSNSNEKVKFRTRDVAEVGSSEEENCLRKLKDLKVKAKEVDDKDKNLSRMRVPEGEEKARSKRVKWLRSHIRVRITSQEFKGGRYFLKKGVVVDVVGPGVCNIAMDENRQLLEEVRQELLETALPKRGGPVLVLYGKHKGVYGTLLERDSDEEMGVVRDADTHELLNVKLGQIAEYTGDPSDLGY